jgi:hypothetical protein
MKSTATFLVSAIAAGAGTAFLLGMMTPGAAPTSMKAALFRHSAVAMRNVVAAVQDTPAMHALESTVVKLAETVIPSEKLGNAEMLLSEPVIILTATSNGWQRLEAGKKVTLIANEGRFIRVKYEEKEVSIPRTAVTQGIASIQ